MGCGYSIQVEEPVRKSLTPLDREISASDFYQLTTQDSFTNPKSPKSPRSPHKGEIEFNCCEM